MTYYEELDVRQDASAEEIKKAYRRLMVAFHPDNYRGDERYATNKISRIQEAYGVLSDRRQRTAYDREIFDGLRNHARRDMDDSDMGDPDTEDREMNDPDIAYYNAEDFCDESEYWNEWAEEEPGRERRGRAAVWKQNRAVKRNRKNAHRSRREERLRIFYMTVVTAVLVATAMIGIFMLGRFTGQTTTLASAAVETSPQYIVLHNMHNFIR